MLIRRELSSVRIWIRRTQSRMQWERIRRSWVSGPVETPTRVGPERLLSSEGVVDCLDDVEEEECDAR